MVSCKCNSHKTGYSEVIRHWALNNFKESPQELTEMVESILS